MPTVKKSNNILIIFASPHSCANTKHALSLALQSLGFDNNESVKITQIDIYQKTIRPCTDCKACLKGECVFNELDDMKDVLQQIHSSNTIIFATPIYFNSVPAPLKCFIDRLQQEFAHKFILRQSKIVKDKTGILVTSMGSTDDFALKCVKSTFTQVFSCLASNFNKYYYLNNTDNQTTIKLKEFDLS